MSSLTRAAGVETANGTYNQTYLALAQDIVSLAGDGAPPLTSTVVIASSGGIYTLIDAHQDVLSQKFCGEVMTSFLAAC